MFLKQFCLFLHNQQVVLLPFHCQQPRDKFLLICLMPKPLVKIAWHKLKESLCSSPSSLSCSHQIMTLLLSLNFYSLKDIHACHFLPHIYGCAPVKSLYERRALISTFGHNKYNAWHKHCCLLMMTACNWMAAVSSRLIGAHRNMFRHTQQSPILVWCRVTGKWTRFRYCLIGLHIIPILIIHSSLLLTVTVISHAR